MVAIYVVSSVFDPPPPLSSYFSCRIVECLNFLQLFRLEPWFLYLLYLFLSNQQGNCEINLKMEYENRLSFN